MLQHSVVSLSMRLFGVFMVRVRSTKHFRPQWALRLFAAVVLVMLFPLSAQACCTGCPSSDCNQATSTIDQEHSDLRQNTQDEWDADLEAYQRWLIEIFLSTEVVPAMAAMATQMSATAMFYTEMVGAFFDAQVHMDTQRLLRRLQLDAHKDYRPSEDFCWFGTNVKSLVGSESRGRFNSLALSRTALRRQLGAFGSAGAEVVANDYKARWLRFTDAYCDYRDNNYMPITTPSPDTLTDPSLRGDTGLTLACGVNILDSNRLNRDIDYTRLIDEPRTIDADFTNDTLDTTNVLLISPYREPGDEEDVIALSQNLYGHRVLPRGLTDTVMNSDTARKFYLALRGVAAKRSVAQATYNAIVGLKSSGVPNGDLITSGSGALGVHPSGEVYIGEVQRSRRFLAAIVDQLLPSNPAADGSMIPQGGNIYELIGYMPSYYSQLEILAKRIYQNPDFYANLYDTPVNVARKKVAMRAIELMVDRAMYESQIRREMSISVLLASKLRGAVRNVERDLSLATDN